MADNKVKSFRIDDETANKFKEIASAIGGNQQETLSELIKVYEFQNSKMNLPNLAGQIETVQKYANTIVDYYMQALQQNADMKETIYTEFRSQLASKESTITYLQEKNCEAEKSLAEIEKCLATKKEESEALKSVLEEKEEIIELLRKEIKTLKENNASLDIAKELKSMLDKFMK